MEEDEILKNIQSAYAQVLEGKTKTEAKMLTCATCGEEYEDGTDHECEEDDAEDMDEAKKLDPVGKEDGDIDNDGDKDASDEYLMNRRKAISKAIKKESFDVDAFAGILEAMGGSAKGSTAQYGPTDATRDTWDKQLDTRKGEKDFVGAHEVETPEFADGVKVNNKTFADAGKSVKTAPKRPNDSSIGDKKPVENDGK
jgi:hypothetical protein